MPEVPGTAKILELIADEYGSGDNALAREFLAKIPAEGNRYQLAFERLVRLRGQNAANSVIRAAVLLACDRTRGRELVEAAAGGDVGACEQLANDVRCWQLNGKLRALGELATRLANPHCWILTTNFDPLIDVAVRASGGQVLPIVSTGDDSYEGIRPAWGHVLVFHVHGSWYGADTLHTAEVLTRERRRLRVFLRDLMRDRLIVAVGYAGWQDVITLALEDLVNEPAASFDLRWAFREGSLSMVEATVRVASRAASAGIGYPCEPPYGDRRGRVSGRTCAGASHAHAQGPR